MTAWVYKTSCFENSKTEILTKYDLFHRRLKMSSAGTPCRITFRRADSTWDGNYIAQRGNVDPVKNSGGSDKTDAENAFARVRDEISKSVKAVEREDCEGDCVCVFEAQPHRYSRSFTRTETVPSVGSTDATVSIIVKTVLHVTVLRGECHEGDRTLGLPNPVDLASID